MALKTSFANHLLIAMPSMNDPVFKHAVIYLCEHQSEGAIGLIINQPMQYQVDLIFDMLQIQPNHAKMRKDPLLFGGPLQPERGFVIHRPFGDWRTSISLREDVTITTSSDIIQAIAKDTGPEDALITLGYVGWDSEQLEQEMKNNDWLVCPYAPELLYEVPYNERWEYAGRLLGVDMNQIYSSVGHA